MPAFGPQQTWPSAPHMSAFEGKSERLFAGPARSVGRLIGDPSGEHPIPHGANQEEPTVLGREEKQGAEVHNAEVAHG